MQGRVGHQPGTEYHTDRGCTTVLSLSVLSRSNRCHNHTSITVRSSQTPELNAYKRNSKLNKADKWVRWVAFSGEVGWQQVGTNSEWLGVWTMSLWQGSSPLLSIGITMESQTGYFIFISNRDHMPSKHCICIWCGPWLGWCLLMALIPPLHWYLIWEPWPGLDKVLCIISCTYV